MTRLSKKQREMELFRAVFKSSVYPDVTSSERPDFILKNRTDFGVEVTEFYVDGTAARIENKPEYVDDLVNDKKVDKADAGKYETVKVEYQNKKGNWVEIPDMALKQENLPVTDRLALLVKQINGKIEDRLSYERNIAHVDLIIHDRRGALLDEINDHYVRYHFSQFAINRLFRRGFRNVYLVVPAGKGNEKEIIRLT